MDGEWTGDAQEPSEPDSVTPDALERQAREAMAQIRVRFGDLGSRVRRVVERAGEHWEAAAPAPGTGNPQMPVSVTERARALARHWADVDFLVDPELAAGIAVHRLDEAALWRVELRERGETRLLEERTAPYRGPQPAQPQVVRSLWEYHFPATPEIEAGDRRERVPGAGSVLACDACGGTGTRDCHACEGSGRHACGRCRGSGRLTCPRCRGRGRLTRPHAGASQAQLHVERLAKEAGERVIDLRDRVVRDWSKSFRPAFEWTPALNETAETIPCPDCQGGTLACDCDGGQQVCETCGGSGAEECPRCKGTGRTVRYQEVVRRFDTRVGTRALPLEERAADWLSQEALTRAQGEPVWTGALNDARGTQSAPAGVPADVWREALAFTAAGMVGLPDGGGAGDGDRRVISRQLSLIRVPLTHLDYEFAARRYVVTAYGPEGQERFWAESFPHRWSRVGRFLRAISRDLGEAGAPPADEQSGRVSALDEYRAKRADPTSGSGGSSETEE